MPATHDLFLSYRRADKASVTPLVAALEARGLRVWQDAREVDDFASIQHAVTTGLAHARALLAWYSARYNESRACQWELTSAYLAGQAEGDPRRRVLVVNPEPGNAHVQLPELFDQLHLSGVGMPDDPAAVAALAERIHAALDRDTPDEPMGGIRSLTPPRWLPHQATGSNRFVGRLREMWQLHGALQAGQAAMLTGSGGKPGLAQVRGAGGIGKSLLAEEYALRFGAAYPGGVFWLRAYGYTDSERVIGPEERSALRDSQLIDLAARLGLPIQGLTPPEVIGQLGRHLGHAGLPFLWIVDDLPPEPGPEGLAPWLAPHPLGCTLITTRARRYNHVSLIDLPQLTEAEAQCLLSRGRPADPADIEALRTICLELGCHALAVDVGAALIERRGFAAFLDRLHQASADKDVLEVAARLDEALPNGHQRSIAATLLGSLRELDGNTLDMLRLATQLARAPIPRTLLWRALEIADGLPADDAQDLFDSAASNLLARSLADPADFSSISVHTLVCRTIRHYDKDLDRTKALRGAAVEVMLAEMPPETGFLEYQALDSWLPHVRELSRIPGNAKEADLSDWFGLYELAYGRYVSAHGIFSAEYELRARLFGEEHPETLTSLSNIAVTLGRQGDLRAARRHEERILELRRRTLGEEHKDTLKSINNIALTCWKLGELSAARDLLEALMPVQKKICGEDSLDTLKSMNNLAAVLHSQSDLQGARKVQEATLQTLGRVLGADHPQTITSMNNLAGTLFNQGEVQEARQLFETVLKLRCRVLGDEHPDTLRTRNNLAVVLLKEGAFDGARKLFETVLRIQRHSLGDEHPDALTSMNNLAAVLRSLGDLHGAQEILTEVIRLRFRVIGERHPDTLTSMHNLAVTLGEKGDSAGARDLHESVLDTRIKVLGEHHPDTMKSREKLDAILVQDAK